MGRTARERDGRRKVDVGRGRGGEGQPELEVPVTIWHPKARPRRTTEDSYQRQNHQLTRHPWTTLPCMEKPQLILYEGREG